MTGLVNMAAADIDGDGKPELINAPLIRPKALAPRYEDKVPLVYYRTDDWKRRTIDDHLNGVLHRLRVVHWNGGKRRFSRPASTESCCTPPRAAKRRILTAIEPWHGNEVVVYTEDSAHKRNFNVIFSELVEGHEVVVGDFNGDGLDDIAAGDRGAKGASVHVFYAQDDHGAKWNHQIIDHGGTAGWTSSASARRPAISSGTRIWAARRNSYRA